MVESAQREAGACPDAEQLLLFARGKLHGDVRIRVESHAQVCAACTKVVSGFTPPVLSSAGVSSRGVDAVADTAFAFMSRTGGAARSHVLVGDVVDGKYRIEKVVGAGGMGVVVAATHVQIGREVALKFMRPDACESVDAVARFVREARAIVKIQSEHVARLLDVGTLEHGEPFMVMELLKGNDLADLLRDGGALALPDAVDFVLQACEAIAEAHRLGIIHRDLKPANLFVTQGPDGTPLVKVLDFGVSKLSADSLDSGVGLTGSRAALGSPRYMSPEQLASPKTVGPPADIWALGCILYELLTARFAFDGETLHGIALDIATGETPRVRDVRSGAPSAIDQVIAACLEKEPGKRPQSIADLALLLAPLAPPRSSISIERICRLTGRASPAPSAPRGASRAKAVIGGVVIVGALALATLSPFATRPAERGPPPAAASVLTVPVTHGLEPPPLLSASLASVASSPSSSPSGPATSAPSTAPPPPDRSSTVTSRSGPARPHPVAQPSPRPSSVMAAWVDPPPTTSSNTPDPMQHGLQDRK